MLVKKRMLIIKIKRLTLSRNKVKQDLFLVSQPMKKKLKIPVDLCTYSQIRTH